MTNSIPQLSARQLARYFFMVLGVLLACSPSMSRADKELVVKEINAVIPKNFPPYYEIDADGNPSGFAIEVLKAVAKRANLKVRFTVEESWAKALETFKEGKVDVLPNLGISDSRKAFADFTVPMDTFKISIFVRNDETRFLTLNDLSTYSVGVRKSNLGVSLIGKIRGAKAKTYENFREMLDELQAKKIDAFIYPETVAWEVARSVAAETRIRTFGPPLREVKRGIAVRKGLKDLHRILNDGLVEFLETLEFQEIYRRKFDLAPKDGFLNSNFWFLIGSGFVIYLLLTGFRIRKRLQLQSSSPSRAKLLVNKVAEESKSFVVLLLVMAGVALGVMVVAIGVLYTASVDEAANRLSEMAKSHAGLMDSMLRTDLHRTSDTSDEALSETISQFRDGLSRLSSTAEIAIAIRDRESIKFLFRQKSNLRYEPAPISALSPLAKPMRNALDGKSGTMIGLDYRNRMVLAAYEPVSTMNIGIVVKIDMKEIRSPYLRAAVIAGILGLIIVLIGSLIFQLVSGKVIGKIIDSEARYRDLAEGSIQGILVHDQLVPLYANDAFCKMFGYDSVDQVLNLGSITALVSEDERDRMSDRAASRLAGEKISVISEFVGVKSDGTEFYFESSGRTISWDGKNAAQATVIDITDRKNADRLSAQNEKRFRSAFENISIGNVIIDDLGIIEIFNDAAERMFGYSAEEVVGQNVRLLMPEPYKKNHDGYLHKYRETGEKKIIGVGREVVGVRKNGDHFPIHLGVGEMINNDRISFVGSITDLTEIKALEEQLRHSQRLEAIGQLTGGIAHDFNNLLAVMAGNVYMLERKAVASSDVDRSIEGIRQAVNRGSSLTRQLLAFSRKQTLAPISTNISILINDLADMFRRTLGETIDLRVNLEADLWLAMIDPNLLEDALLNLAINARDAMPYGGAIEFKVSNVTIGNNEENLDDGLEPGKYLNVSVIDNGHGIPPDDLNRVFEPFFTTKEFGKGSGLGLSMVFGFIKQSGGHIRIDSKVGIGTTINLFLPRSQKRAAYMKKRLKPQENDYGTGRILVVEDDEELREVTADILLDYGYDIVTAANGIEAFQCLGNGEPFDLIFTDVVLPGGTSGIDIASEAQLLYPGLKVVFTSGYAEAALLKDSKIRPDEVLLSKPYNSEELLDALRVALDRSEPSEIGQ